MRRRRFVKILGTSFAGWTVPALVAEEKSGVHWPVGCFNRPWTKWSYETALAGMEKAGYRLTGLLTRTKEEPFISSGDPAYLAGLKKRISEHHLKANMAALRTRPELPLAEAKADLRLQIENANKLQIEHLLTFGVDKPEQYETYYKMMGEGAARCEDLGMKLVLKPHGGGSGAAEEILRSLDRVKHKNFRVWYDAGNIIYYTGKDPVQELEPIVQYVTGFCAKDCAQPKGDVMIQFGEGRVDFPAVFKRLKAAGFQGPVMVEGCRVGASAEETTSNARANREFLERIFKTI